MAEIFLVRFSAIWCDSVRLSRTASLIFRYVMDFGGGANIVKMLLVSKDERTVENATTREDGISSKTGLFCQFSTVENSVENAPVPSPWFEKSRHRKSLRFFVRKAASHNDFS